MQLNLSGFRTRPGSSTGRPAACFRVVFGLLLLTLGPVTNAMETRHLLGSGVQLHCQHPAKTRLECDYRLLNPSRLEQVSARIGNLNLPAPVRAPQPKPRRGGAILILVDTSDPARRAAVEKNVEHINALIDAAGAEFRLGLAAFDSDFELLAAIGSSPAVVRAAASMLSPAGPTTELYRNALEAVRVLEQTPAERRALVIMSDGLAEDRAYFHRDVVSAAQTAGVNIFGIGYPRSVPLSVGLQSLRRLAEETGGRYADTGVRFELPGDFLDQALASLQSDGRLTLNFGSAARAGLGGEQTIELEFELADGRASAKLPVRVPGEVTTEAAAPEAEPVTANDNAAPDSPFPRAPTAATVQLWYVMLPGALLVALLLFLMFSLRTRRGDDESDGGNEDALSTGPMKAMRWSAYLESRDDGNLRHAVTRAAFRIGRHSENDLSIRDASVSRQHAEIHRRRDGTFTITDLDSMNGVFVNQKKIDSVTIRDGDIIEIGDASFCFHKDDQLETTGIETVEQTPFEGVHWLKGISGRR